MINVQVFICHMDFYTTVNIYPFVNNIVTTADTKTRLAGNNIISGHNNSFVLSCIAEVKYNVMKSQIVYFILYYFILYECKQSV